MLVVEDSTPLSLTAGRGSILLAWDSVRHVAWPHGLAALALVPKAEEYTLISLTAC
jgi:hypothetical protein